MTCNFFYVKANIWNLKRFVIAKNHDITFIFQEIYKSGLDSVRIRQQVCGLVYNFLNQHVNFYDLLGAG